MEINLANTGAKITKRIPYLELNNDNQILAWVELFKSTVSLVNWTDEQTLDVIKELVRHSVDLAPYNFTNFKEILAHIENIAVPSYKSK